MWASVVAALGLQSTGSGVEALGLVATLWHMRLLRPGIEPVSFASQGRFLTY